MNLDRCTPGQREIITTLDAPLMVAAGAGSGKTFTLTQRIVGAFGGQGENPPAISSIDEVLAITFTKKAAAELKGRIKALLIQEKMRSQALAVDDAWICTIHGMASRILRDHALELGLDPAFEVMSESDAEELRAQAVDNVAHTVQSSEDPLMAELVSSIPLFAKSEGQDSLVARALKILSHIEAMPAGFDGLVVASPTHTPGSLMRELYELGRAFADVAAGWARPTATEQKITLALQNALAGAEVWLAEQGARSFCDPNFDAEGYRAALYAFPPTSDKFHAKKDDADFFASYRSDYARISQEAESGIAARHVASLVELARMIADEFSRLKGPSRLDNTDLLALVSRALSSHPGIAESYRDRFKLIMVDEFQDTDKLQVSIISQLAQPKLSNVCTVGDAQQSIYRFRGADVNVFFEYRDDLRALNPHARFVSLPDNFRSHADVLTLVDAVFSLPAAFGQEFLHLEPRSSINAELDPVFGGVGRIHLDFVHYKSTTGQAKGVSSQEAATCAARHIALHFAGLRDRGARVKDMALLLGGMTRASIYADALREQGMESVIVGGSVFASSAEAQVVDAALRFAVNAEDEPALFALLISSLFSLSDDALLALASVCDEHGAWHPRSFARGFADASAPLPSELPDQQVQALDRAREVLRRFSSRARGGHVAAALRELLVATGALDRLAHEGACGLAAAGNYAKAVQIVEGFEQKACGVATVSRLFAEHLRCAKEAPGSLSTVGEGFVRIMTVHASKGLEFPHVAVAELGTGVASREALLVENVAGRTYVGACASATGESAKVVDKLRKFERADEPCESIDSASTPGELYAALDSHMRRQTLSEAQRLLYVALTRASRSLFLSRTLRSNPAEGYGKSGIYQNLYDALRWDTQTDRSVTMAAFGGSAPARITLEYLKTPEDLAADVDAYEAAFKQASGSTRADDADALLYGGGVPRLNGSSGLGEPPAEARACQEDDCESLVRAEGANDELASDGCAEGSLTPGQSSPATFLVSGQSDQASFLVPLRTPVRRPRVTPFAFGREDTWSYSSLHADLPDLALLNEGDPLGGVRLPRIEGDEEVELGSAFHRVAQRAVVCLASHRARGNKDAVLEMPADDVLRAQTRAHALAESQGERLKEACALWFSCALARKAASFAYVEAEVPFAVYVEEGGFYLEGEIDLLASDVKSHGRAFVVDYKTGGFPHETLAYVRQKHLLQAQCYAYALMKAGYESVEAHFARVERPAVQHPGNVEEVTYLFSSDDAESLGRAIAAARS